MKVAPFARKGVGRLIFLPGFFCLPVVAASSRQFAFLDFIGPKTSICSFIPLPIIPLPFSGLFP